MAMQPKYMIGEWGKTLTADNDKGKAETIIGNGAERTDSNGQAYSAHEGRGIGQGHERRPTTPLPSYTQEQSSIDSGKSQSSGQQQGLGGDDGNDIPPAEKGRKRSRVARNQFVIFANFVFTLLVLGVLALGGLLYLAKGQFNGPGPFTEARVILIKPGAGIREIGSLLENEGIVSNSQIFIYGVNWEQKGKDLKAGEFEIPAHASMRDIMEVLVNGRSIEHAFTVPEGLTVQQVFDRLAANEMLVGDMPKKLPLEGSLMTDTVRFVRGTTRAEIVKRLKDGQSKLVQEIWRGRDADLPLKDINELVTLASIVEKETGVASERPRVAAVFYNRLKKNMRLQSDPTVIYGIFGGKGKPSDRPIYRSDLEKETPFNTYRINGLPPSPIANPGRDALKAVANPPHTEDLYFVADGTGGHVFASTLDEHNSNVRKWREYRRSLTVPTTTNTSTGATEDAGIKN